MPAKTGRKHLPAWLRTILIYSLIFVITSFIANLWLTRNQAQGLAPEVAGMSLDGNQLQIDYSQYSKPLILYFFADWCPICKFQHPVIRSLNEDYPVIAIAMQSGSDQQITKYLQQHELSLPVINDADGEISSAFGVQGVPATFIIQPDARIAFTTRGYTSEIGMLLRLWSSQFN